MDYDQPDYCPKCRDGEFSDPENCDRCGYVGYVCPICQGVLEVPFWSGAVTCLACGWSGYL